MGSGSAARSIFGGFSCISLSDRRDGECFARPAPSHTSLDLQMIVVKCSNEAKIISSREGMLHTAKTSPYYQAWVDSHPADMKRALAALSDGNLLELGEAMEHSTLKMHATMMAAQPGFTYLNATTFDVMNEVRRARADGKSCYFTMDAGPHVKVLCERRDAPDLASALKLIPNVVSVEIASPGPGVTWF